MGFLDWFWRLVMRCITTVSYSVLLSGVRTRTFIPSCGIRQGDPLSPYLFLSYVRRDVLPFYVRQKKQGTLRGLILVEEPLFLISSLRITRTFFRKRTSHKQQGSRIYLLFMRITLVKPSILTNPAYSSVKVLQIPCGMIFVLPPDP